jgi:hypothetical protein
VRLGKVDDEVFVDAPAAAIFEKRDTSSVDFLLFVFELDAKELLERIEIERVDAWGRMIATADVGSGEDTRCWSFTDKVIDNARMER